jgi:TRAP-type C4-dicarboxylate transport system permease small subunit
METLLLATTLGAMVILAALQILLRNVWGTGLGWADETLRILVLWVMMLGAVAASREQRHVSIDALSRYLPPGLRGPAALLIEGFTGAVCLALAWYCYLFVADSLEVGERALGGQLPAWTVQAILPFGFGLMGYRYVLAFVRRALGHWATRAAR